jgi:Zn-dependent peptidase ImmA (M78 family)
VICRSSQSKEEVEVQADLYASSLLMPRKLIMQAWREHFGNDHPRVLREKDRIVVPCDVDDDIAATVRSFELFARPFAELFLVSPIAMCIRLEKLGLLRREVPTQRSVLARA